jgi:23S rRNA pseudouridine2605 synthase
MGPWLSVAKVQLSESNHKGYLPEDSINIPLEIQVRITYNIHRTELMNDMPISPKIRLNKFIADCGYCSRGAAEKLIKEGQILVNRIREINPGRFVHPKKDSVKVLTGPYLKAHKNTKIILVNKPLGYTCTKTDPQNNMSIFSILPKDCQHLSVQSRLKREHEGLIILKNGSLPYQHIIEYEIQFQEKISNKTLKNLQWKIKESTIPFTILSLKETKETTTIVIRTNTIDQLELPKLLSRIKSPKKLVRTRIGEYTLHGTKPGDHRHHV